MDRQDVQDVHAQNYTVKISLRFVKISIDHLHICGAHNFIRTQSNRNNRITAKCDVKKSMSEVQLQPTYAGSFMLLKDSRRMQ